MKTTGIFAVLLLMVFILSSCDKEGNQKEIDANLIKEYIEENGLTAQSTESGLYYVIDEPGNSEHPEAGDEIFIIYTGWFLDGGEFDSSDNKTVDFPINNLIQGWREGIPLFGKGGKGTLLVPSHLGYGSQGRGSIPPNAVLRFYIELIDFN